MFKLIFNSFISLITLCSVAKAQDCNPVTPTIDSIVIFSSNLIIDSIFFSISYQTVNRKEAPDYITIRGLNNYHEEKLRQNQMIFSEDYAKVIHQEGPDLSLMNKYFFEGITEDGFCFFSYFRQGNVEPTPIF